MTRKSLFKKYYKNPLHGYEISETLSATDNTGRSPDVCFVYSGRNRGKSYEISTQLIADAWYDRHLFGYIRRNKATTYEIEQYFADKTEFITDMTDGTREGITVNRGKIYLYHSIDDEKTGGKKRVLDEQIGYFFSLSTQNAYKSLQYPDVWSLLYEEVLTDGNNYLAAEPEKLMNLWSTVSRSRPGFHMWLISNTVSVVNPYSQSWGIQLAKNKPGEIRLSKLFLGTYDKNKHEEYMLIAAHYLENKDEVTGEDRKSKRLRVKTGISSNKWDELHLYTTIDKSFLDPYKPIASVVFEYDDLMFLVEIIMKPSNIYQLYSGEQEKESRLKMPFAYVQRKTSEPKEDTRLYTNNNNRFGLYVTKGYRIMCKIDENMEIIRRNGWFIGSDNLTMNDFMSCFTKLRSVI